MAKGFRLSGERITVLEWRVEIYSTSYDVLFGGISIKTEHPRLEWRVESGD